MRIGLLTFHRALNYGAVLQCYALQQELRRHGHDVDVIDYRQPVVEEAYRPIKWKWLIKKILLPWRLPPYLRQVAALRRGHRTFGRFRDQFLSLSPACGRDDVPSGYDGYVIGSDQLWARHITGDFDPVYFGDFTRRPDSRLVGYAVSANIGSMRQLGNDAQRRVNAFDAFSFRERALAEGITRPDGSPLEITLDPTLLADPSIWEPMIDRQLEEGRYVVLYEVRRRSDDPGLLRRHADRLAASLGWRVVDLSANDADVGRFVSALRYAGCVITSSFHATAFSLIFNRPFYTYMLHDGHDSRYVDLLSAIGLDGALVEPDFEPSDIPVHDFESAHRGLDAMRDKSLRFLLDGLSGGNKKP
ncbi:MAG: polysaccharide pyruvyl transferase family protein [Pseudoflavonifractor sp.]|nr:polysaccharide pyruvyl transferase family protein [Pseudoflavonifractor sp.]